MVLIVDMAVYVPPGKELRAALVSSPRLSGLTKMVEIRAEKMGRRVILPRHRGASIGRPRSLPSSELVPSRSSPAQAKSQMSRIENSLHGVARKICAWNASHTSNLRSDTATCVWHRLFMPPQGVA